MPHENSRVHKIGEDDRLATFALETYLQDGSIQQEQVVAYGDGVTLPYRATLKKQGYDLAASAAFITPTSTVTAVNTKKLSGLTGAMLARQSRAQGTVVDVLVNEFLVQTPEESEKLGIPVGELKVKKLDEIIERILLQYGDDSVQELETATVLFNSVSNLASKLIEDRRLGSFIEQSSRYIVYNDRDLVTGKFAYYRDPRIMASSHGEAYERVLDRAFLLYTKLVDELVVHYETLKPLDQAEYAVKPQDKTLYKLADLTEEKEQKEFRRVYKFDIKTRACDTARVVLPAATLTNLAMVANGRTYEHLLKRLYSHEDMHEYQDIGQRLHSTLNELIPKYVKRASPNGDILAKNEEKVAKNHLLEHYPEFLIFSEHAEEEVVPLDIPNLLQSGRDGMAHILASLYFPFARVSFSQIVERLKKDTVEILLQRLRDFSSRTSRRDRYGRGWEHGYACTFDIVANFGVFRDLHRHRILTQQRQYLQPFLGFTLPEDIKALGRGGEVWALVAEVKELYRALEKDFGAELAQYCVLFGHHIRFTMGFSLREAQHLLELRTIPQGHPDYRRICQKMTTSIHERAPWIQDAGLLQFVDYQEYPWARAAAEARQSQKLLEKGLA